MKPDHPLDNSSRLTGRWPPALVAIAVTLPFALYFVGLYSSYVPLFEDQAQWSIYPRFVGEAYGRGLLPLWTHDLYAGFPLVAWSHAAIFYPLAVIFQWWDFPQAVWINQWVHCLIFSLGLFALCRVWASREAAAAAAAAGGLLFVLVALMNFVPQTRTGAWAPLWLLTLHGTVACRQARWLRRHALVTLAMFLGGDVELIMLGYELAAVAGVAAAVAGLGRGRPARRALAPALLAAVALGLGFFLSLIQTLPTFELSRLSLRRYGLDYELRQIFVLPPVVLLGLPALAPLLALAAAGWWSRRGSVIFWMAAVCLPYSLVVAFNPFGFLRVMDYVPALGGLAAQYRITLYAFVALMALAAAGGDAIGRSPGAARWMAAVGAGTILSQLLLLGLARLLAASDFVLFYQMDAARVAIYAGTLPVVAVGLWLLMAPRWASARPRRSRQLLLAALVLLCLPVPAAMPRKPARPDDGIDRYREFVRRHPGRYRTQSVYRLNDFPDIVVPAQTGRGDGTMAADSWITVTIDRYARLLDAFLPGAVTEKNGRISGYAAHRILKEGTVDLGALKLYNLLGVRYLLADRVNLKFATDYFLAYPDSPFAGQPGVRLGNRDGRATLTFRGSISGRLFLQPGDRLQLQAEPACPGQRLAVTVVEDGKPRLLLEQELTAESSADLSAELSEARSAGDRNSGTLTFSATAGEPCEITLIDPTIRNPAKYFRREAFAASFAVFQNPGALPLAFLAAQTRAAAREEAVALMLAPGWDPSRTAVAEGLPDRFFRALRKDEAATITSMDWSGVSVAARADVPRTLVLTDAYYPGWEAWVNGRPARIHPVDLAFKGIDLAPGRSEVRLEFRPVSFRVGLWATLASLATLWLGPLARVFGKSRARGPSHD